MESVFDRADVKILVNSLEEETKAKAKAPTHSPCGLLMSQFSTDTFTTHILECRVCGDALRV